MPYPPTGGSLLPIGAKLPQGRCLGKERSDFARGVLAIAPLRLILHVRDREPVQAQPSVAKPVRPIVSKPPAGFAESGAGLPSICPSLAVFLRHE